MMMTAVGYAIMWSALNHPGHPVPLFRGQVTVVRASGIGLPPRRMRGVRATLMAQRAAEVVAVANLARRMGYGPSARVRGFRYVSASVRPDGSVRVVVEKRVPEKRVVEKRIVEKRVVEKRVAEKRVRREACAAIERITNRSESFVFVPPLQGGIQGGRTPPVRCRCRLFPLAS